MSEPVKILLVDDNDDFRELLYMSFSRFGFDIKTAFDGIDALEKIRDFQPQILVTDVRMPNLDGYGLWSS